MIGSPLIIAEKARARLNAMLSSMRDGEVEQRPHVDLIQLPNPGDLVVSASEVNELHGTGTLLLRIFADSSSIISLRTHDFYDGQQSFGAARLCLPLARAARPEILSWLRWYLGTGVIRRILCVPYTPAEPMVALAAHEMTGAPLCTYIMDDKNVCAEGISDDLMHELCAKSQLRLVISPEMRDAYQRKYRMRFFVMPPVVAPAIVRLEPGQVPEGKSHRAVLLGNVWGQRWLEMLRETFRSSGFLLDWHCNQKAPTGLNFDAAELERDGVRMLDPVSENDLPATLSNYAITVVPSDPLDGKSPGPVRAVAELSLPSRIVTIMAAAHLPILVLGSPETCAARFVQRFGLGSVAPYETSAVKAAFAALLVKERQSQIRARAAGLAQKFSAEGAADWIWKSLSLGTACSEVYEELMP